MEEGRTNLSAENQLLLDQSLLRLPLELARRKFRSAQIYIEHDQKATLTLLKEATKKANTQDPTETLKSIDKMLSRMQVLKRKLETLQAEEQKLHEQSSKRIRHIDGLYEATSLVDVKYETWSRTRLDRLMVDYLLRTGHSETALALAQSRGVTDLLDLDTFVSFSKVLESIQRGQVKDTLVWVAENKASIKKVLDKQVPAGQTTPAISELEFELRFQQYVEILRKHHPPERSTRNDAVVHVQKYLTPHAALYPQQVQTASGLLTQDPKAPGDPYREYFDAARWMKLCELFNELHHAILNVPSRPLLQVALSAGLSALKTPACHSRHNPTSSATPDHPQVAMTSHTSGLCPICSTELNELARIVPYAHHTKSVVENDPRVLPNNRIYGKDRLFENQRNHMRAAGLDKATEEQIGRTGTEVKDPITGETFHWEDVRKVYIT